MQKIEYCFERNFEKVIYESETVSFKEFETCSFNECDFSKCNFTAVTFIDCTFRNCNFSGSKVNHTAFRGALFINCIMRDLNFAMCDKLIFEINFTDCILDFSKFYALKIKGTTFTRCSLIAVDFMETDLSGVLFDCCDLYRALFMKSIAIRVDFTSSFNYSIDPENNKISKALFSLAGVKGLLDKYEIIVE